MFKNLFKNEGFTLVEVLVSMAVAGIILTVSVTMFNAALDIRNDQVRNKDALDNIRTAMDYLRDDIEQAGAYMGGHGYFNYYSGVSNMPNRQFCLDFDAATWPDLEAIRSAWQARFPGWTLESSSEDMVQIWYGNEDVYTIVDATINTLGSIPIQDNPVHVGFVKGDYVLFIDAEDDQNPSAVRGSQSNRNWLTVLTDTQEIAGNYKQGTLLFNTSVPWTDSHKSPADYQFGLELATKTDFRDPDRIAMVHRIIYGIMSKPVQSPQGTRMARILIRDDCTDPAGLSRYNPLIVATNVEGIAFSTIFKLPFAEATTRPPNYYNSVRLDYHYNMNSNMMFGTTLANAYSMDQLNNDYTDHDPRDLKSVQIELIGISSKRDNEAARGSNAPPVYRTPALGVMEYPPSAGMTNDVRIPGAALPDYYIHTKMVVTVGIRSIRMSDFAVNPS